MGVLRICLHENAVQKDEMKTLENRFCVYVNVIHIIQT